MPQLQDTTLALAAVLQASHLVYQLAHQGIYSEEDSHPLVHSLFQFDAPDTPAVYGDISQLRLGLELLQAYFGGSSPAYAKNPDVIRYALAVLTVERHFSQSPVMQEEVHMQLLQAETDMAGHFELDSLLFSKLAKIYENNLSQLGFRVYIKGNVEHLKNPRYVAKIRTLLLAAVRSAMLWRQFGGNRWQLFFKRGKIVQCSNDYLRQIKALS